MNILIWISNIDDADADHDIDGLPLTYSSHIHYSMASLGGRRPNPPENIFQLIFII